MRSMTISRYGRSDFYLTSSSPWRPCDANIYLAIWSGWFTVRKPREFCAWIEVPWTVDNQFYDVSTRITRLGLASLFVCSSYELSLLCNNDRRALEFFHVMVLKLLIIYVVLAHCTQSALSFCERFPPLHSKAIKWIKTDSWFGDFY